MYHNLGADTSQPAVPDTNARPGMDAARARRPVRAVRRSRWPAAPASVLSVSGGDFRRCGCGETRLWDWGLGLAANVRLLWTLSTTAEN